MKMLWMPSLLAGLSLLSSPAWALKKKTKPAPKAATTKPSADDGKKASDSYSDEPEADYSGKKQYPADDYDDAFVGQDTMFKSNGNPLRLLYLGVYAGAATESIKHYGALSYSFDAGFRFHPHWSTGVFLSTLPQQQTLLSREDAAIFGGEIQYHLDKLVENLYVGGLLGFLNVENTSNLAIGAKIAYDYPIAQFFWLSTQVTGILNTKPKKSGNAAQILFGFKFQRGKNSK